MSAIAARFESIGEARAAASALDAAGIDHELVDANLAGVDWLATRAIGSIKLIVREEDLQSAREILECSSEAAAFDGDASDSESDSSAVAPQTCPECGSPNLVKVPLFRFLFLGALFFLAIGAVTGETRLGIIGAAVTALAVLMTPTHRCGECDHRFSPGRPEVAPLPNPKDIVEEPCPRCGSREVYRINYRRLKAIPLLLHLSIFVIAPLLLMKPARRCDACGFEL